MLLAIDPGTTESAYVIMDGYVPIEFGKIENERMAEVIAHSYLAYGSIDLAIERIESYGQQVSESIFSTVFWCGRFWQLAITRTLSPHWVTRRAVKSNMCKGERFETKTWDSKVAAALRQRFGEKGTKANHGFFFGFKDDVWQAFAVGVTYLDKKK